MAFDVYTGTMTRFYRREWENVAQKAARELGITYSMIFAGGDPEPPAHASDIQEAVDIWCESLTQGLRPHGVGPVKWSESEAEPYFTDRPSWDGYSGLVLWSAYAQHPELSPPTELPESWVDDIAFRRSTAAEFKSQFQQIQQPQLWLPVDFPFVFDAATLTSDRECIGSTFALKEQLELLHAQTSDHLDQMIERYPQNDLFQAAQFGLSVFRFLAEKACEHRLPILLSF